MKRILLCGLSLLLAALLCFTACGEYNPADRLPGNNVSTGEETEAVTTPDGEVPENPFTVTLMLDGQVFIPAEPISVEWSDGFSLHTAPIGSDGVARVGGLDGDYRVTLSALPAGYTYNPNAYTATNLNRHLEIQLYEILPVKGQGLDLYKSIELRYTGLYCVELTSATHEVFYEFAPPKSGTYSVEAWLDTTANEINPQAKYYGANKAFKQLQDVVDDGGAESAYTKNFKLDVEIAEEMISSGGQVVFSFGIRADTKTGQYPVKVYFAITLDGEFSLNLPKSTIIYPEEQLVRQPDYDESRYEFVGAEFPVTVGGMTANVFDSDNYRIWEKSEGGDGYYHLYSEADYPETHGYGPILYAHVTSACRFMDTAFHQVEYAGNKALTVSKGTENYKLFIEGFAALLPDPPGDSGPYFCVTNCPCRLEGTCGSAALGLGVGACTEECTKCHASCRRCPEEAMGKAGYADFVNSDGVYAVTAELQEFLQKYSINQLLFYDGNGFVETHPTVSVFAAEEDQWLFACGYYKEK